MTTKLRLAAASLALLVASCGADDDASSIGYYRLPTGASNYVDLGNEWHTFDLTVAGAKRTFLHKWSGASSNQIECITELSPATAAQQTGGPR